MVVMFMGLACRQKKTISNAAEDVFAGTLELK